ncbi:hypothetical protein QW060_27840 [Myroides ceti]|uniref:Uncharacterized protein n=1 Tax=Paenimyroides ceti TaxID=395087 RepID=A0ABT8D295_9FLAO|nr:hypothetical protein [Paenimyroides ceti]MDN3710594.1 hypothetical protein [Paenimyroides ceti]
MPHLVLSTGFSKFFNVFSYLPTVNTHHIVKVVTSFFFADNVEL